MKSSAGFRYELGTKSCVKIFKLKYNNDNKHFNFKFAH